MTDKQYLAAILQELRYDTAENWEALEEETIKRLEAIESQEDNIKSDMWKEETK